MTRPGPTVLVALPVKDLVNAKQRLVPALAPDERHDLAAAMLEDVLDALDDVEDLAVHLVTRDPEVLAVASRRGTPCLAESANRGHTAAVAFAQREAMTQGAWRSASGRRRSAASGDSSPSRGTCPAPRPRRSAR